MTRRQRIAEVARGLRAAKAAGERERWPLEHMRRHQAAAADALVRHAMKRSPFYRERFAGMVGEGPVRLESLPSLDKATLMSNLDDALCVPGLRGRDLHAQLGQEDPLLGEYRVMASSGSTGTPSLYVYSRADWTGILAVFLRYNELSGIRPRLPRLRLAAIGAPSLASMTQLVAQTVDVGLHRVLRRSVTEPIPKLVEDLNSFQPGAVHVYPSVAALLAAEQLAGRLRIQPHVISTSSELSTPEVADRIEAAFGTRPFDLYGSSEGLWGCECSHRAGIHMFEDWCVFENVDREGRPVPDGEPGERVLVTNLFNRTLPLIRFEVSDVVSIEREPCACGRTLPRLKAIQGRLDDVLELPGLRGETVAVHPTQFSPLAADPEVREFQVVERGKQIELRLVLRDDAPVDTPERLARVVAERLRAVGASEPIVRAQAVPAIERTAAGKLRLVVPDGTPAELVGAGR